MYKEVFFHRVVGTEEWKFNIFLVDLTGCCLRSKDLNTAKNEKPWENKGFGKSAFFGVDFFSLNEFYGILERGEDCLCAQMSTS